LLQERGEADLLWPGLIIIGAPKAGTTALAHYLSEHPQISFAAIKEPHFFATDLPRQRVITTAQDYLGLFEPTGDGTKIRAEASVWYLYSQDAVTRILEVRPDAYLVVMLRNPVDAVHALHQQKIQSADEDVLDFERAFRLQEARRQGKFVPPSCREPSTLLYGDVCSYSGQIERLHRLVPRDQVRIYLYEDFAGDPGAVYRDVLAFIGLADDGRTCFPPVNQSRRPRFPSFNRVVRRPSPMRRWLSGPLKSYLNRRGIYISSALKKINTVIAPRPDLAPQLKRELRSYFAPDVRRLQLLLEQDLSAWLPEGNDEVSVSRIEHGRVCVRTD
jgi:hypothetical protein